MPAAHHLDHVGWLLPVESCISLDFNASSDPLGQSTPLPTPRAQGELEGLAAKDHLRGELSGAARRAHAVWLASTLAPRRAECSPQRQSKPRHPSSSLPLCARPLDSGGGSRSEDCAAKHAGDFGGGDFGGDLGGGDFAGRLDCAAAVLAAVFARRRRSKQAKTGPGDLDERQQVATEGGGKAATEGGGKAATEELATRATEECGKHASLAASKHLGLAPSKEPPWPWRGRRKLNKLKKQNNQGLSGPVADGSAAHLACSTPSAAVASPEGDERERELDRSKRVSGGGERAGEVREAAWYLTRRRKVDRKLALVRIKRAAHKRGCGCGRGCVPGTLSPLPGTLSPLSGTLSPLSNLLPPTFYARGSGRGSEALGLNGVLGLNGLWMRMRMR
jgi:hypothetical protein